MNDSLMLLMKDIEAEIKLHETKNPNLAEFNKVDAMKEIEKEITVAPAEEKVISDKPIMETTLEGLLARTPIDRREMLSDIYRDYFINRPTASLGDHNIRKRLRGAKEKIEARFPTNVISWQNVAAEDDYACHDNTLADDFKRMMDQRLVSAVHDYHIYNLAVRYGKSNPHSSVGYYIHPRVTKIVVDWLQSDLIQDPPKYTL